MSRYFILFVFLIGTSSCVEKYDFVISDKMEGIVIEASISNKSYTQTKLYPADGRFFSVTLSKTSEVSNIRGEYISTASVVLYDENDNSWVYQEDDILPGRYYLMDDLFAAQYGIKYQLRIKTPSGDEFESAWETMPQLETEVGATSFEEITKDKYVWRRSDEKELETFSGINLKVTVPENDKRDQIYYGWSFDPLWIYIAPDAILDSPVRTCWIRTPFYFRNVTLLKDNIGNYDQNLLFLQTKGNHRLFYYCSILITQSVMSENYYYFWKELQAQNDKGGLYDQPPFDLATNFTATNNEKTVNGYFGVVTENAYRWEFNRNDLSYGIVNNAQELCDINYGPPVPGELDSCESCLGYSFGDANNEQPFWW